jgi:hypothetical protein
VALLRSTDTIAIVRADTVFKTGSLSMKAELPPVASLLATFLVTVSGAALGAYLTLISSSKLEHDKRVADALTDVYFNMDAVPKDLSPRDFELRQSLLREKFALFADSSTLIKLAAFEKSNTNCANGVSDECVKKGAEELLLQRQAVGSDTSGRAADAFKSIIVTEKKEQSELRLPETVKRFWVTRPSDMDFTGNDIPGIAGRKVPEDFSRRFPNTKYVVLILLSSDETKGLKFGQRFQCDYTIGVTYQPSVNFPPTLPDYTVHGHLERTYKSVKSEKECLFDAGDSAVDDLFSRSVDELAKYIH